MSLLLRLLRHLTTLALRTPMLFTPAVLTQIEKEVSESERQHSGEIRFAIETALPLPVVWAGVTPRQRALQVFAQLHVWDTHANNGVLIYVLRADRAVEIIADRGISARVTEAEWRELCGAVETEYRAHRYAEGSVAAVTGVASLLEKHFPGSGPTVNELPNQPVLL